MPIKQFILKVRDRLLGRKTGDINTAAENQLYQRSLEPWHLNFIDQLMKRFDLKNRTALEIGCGRGEVAREILRREKTATIHGIDSDLCGLADTKEEIGQRLLIKKMDVNKLEYEDETFDLVYFLNVLEHVGNLDRAFQELKRVLKRGGHIYAVSSPIWTSYRGHHYNHWLSDYHDLLPPWAHLYMTSEELSKVVEAKKGGNIAAEALQYIFESEYLNRCSVRDYRNIVGRSGLKVIEIKDLKGYEFISPPAEEYVNKVSELTGYSKEELEVDGLVIVLRRV